MELIDISKKKYNFTLYIKRKSCGLLFDTLEEIEEYIKNNNIKKNDIKNIVKQTIYKIK